MKPIVDMTEHGPLANPPGDDPDVTVKMPRSKWLLVMKSEPMQDETYTDEGVAIFNAWQPIRNAVNPPPDTRVSLIH